MIELEEDFVIRETIPAGRYLSMKEYADKYEMKYSTVRRMVSRGKIESYYLAQKRILPDKKCDSFAKCVRNF